MAKGGGKHAKDRGVKKIEHSRRVILQQQLGPDRWDAVDSIREPIEKTKMSKRPPSPIAPMEARSGNRRPISPTASLSSQESSPVIPQTRSPPPPIKPHGDYGHHRNEHLEFHYKERRGSISTVQTERTEHIESKELKKTELFIYISIPPLNLKIILNIYILYILLRFVASSPFLAKGLIKLF